MSNGTRTYYGYLIYRAALNEAGIRWYTHGKRSIFLRADTLDGIKELIRNDRRG